MIVSRKVWGNVPRVGAIDPDAEPFKSQFAAERINVIDLTDVTTDDSLNHSKFAESPKVVEMIGRRLASGENFNDKGGLGDKVVQATAGAASTVGSAAGLAISAPIAIVDPNTRESLGSQFDNLGQNVRSTVGEVSHN